MLLAMVSAGFTRSTSSGEVEQPLIEKAHRQASEMVFDHRHTLRRMCKFCHRLIRVPQQLIGLRMKHPKLDKA